MALQSRTLSQADPRTRRRMAGAMKARYLDVHDQLALVKRCLVGDVSLYDDVARFQDRIGDRLDFFEGVIAVADREIEDARRLGFRRGRAS